jgi:hydroxypyruvate isomerase
MPRFAANVSMMFGEWEFLDRFEQAARAGFRAVEMTFPYAAAKKDIATRVRDAGLSVALHNVPPGDFDRGDRGMACLPGREAEFRDSLKMALEYATELGVPCLHCMAGVVPPDAERIELHQCFVENLSFAAAEAKKAGVKLLLEPINVRDIPNYFLNFTEQAVAIIDDVDSDNLFLQFDLYHRQVMQGDLAPTMARVLDVTAHMQIADTPGRHEPGSGEINFPFLFAEMDRLGYAGWVGCEYRPRAGTLEGLGWITPYLR